jgi:hypothetical protein
MTRSALIALAIGLGALSAEAATTASRPPAVVAIDKEADLLKHLAPERPTVFVFLNPGSTLERAFLQDLQSKAGEKVAVAAIHVTRGDEPIARKYEVKSTPTALVYDRRGRLVTRSADAAAIEAAVQKASSVMRIDWVEEGDPRLEEVTRILGGRKPAPGILRTMSLQPEYLAYIHELSRKAHFADGFLDRRTKEMIATYVSALNKCKY